MSVPYPFKIALALRSGNRCAMPTCRRVLSSEPHGDDYIALGEAHRGLRIDFLVHDSEMFDGVDSRQRAAAIQRAREVADATGTQYICALNSDMVPYDDFRKGFAFDEHVRLRLTDGDPAGTLLGMVYDPPSRA